MQKYKNLRHKCNVYTKNYITGKINEQCFVDGDEHCSSRACSACGRRQGGLRRRRSAEGVVGDRAELWEVSERRFGDWSVREANDRRRRRRPDRRTAGAPGTCGGGFRPAEKQQEEKRRVGGGGVTCSAVRSVLPTSAVPEMAGGRRLIAAVDSGGSRRLERLQDVAPVLLGRSGGSSAA